jgi:uncharacterized membrane protein YeaQ/YmgE (transglycosylase-associated protein family)
MTIVVWLLLGLISGFVASKLVDGGGKGLFMDLVLGVVGALAGGAFFHLMGQVGITGFNLWSLFVSTAGAVLVLVAYHTLAWGPRHA